MKTPHKLVAMLVIWSSLSPVVAVTQVTPAVDTSALPALTKEWAETNPYRGNAVAIQVGRAAFNQSCAMCHGDDADGSRSPAPDLRRLGRACGRVKDMALKTRCQSDADNWFVQSVLHGKKKFGIEHMPAWDGILKPQVIWSLRSFVEAPAAAR
jgi:mono/diheme cytochrome c family protein